MDGLKEAAHDILHRIPAWILLLIPFAFFMVIVYLVSLAIPEVIVNHYLFLIAILVVVAISRTVQAWEYGIQVYHFLLFWFAFVYGVWPGILMVFLSTFIVTYFVFYVPKHYLIHTMLGPVLTTITLTFLVTVAGIAGRFFPGYIYSNFVVFPVMLAAVSTLFEKIGAHRFAGVEIGRLASAQVVEIMVNYNLFLFYSFSYVTLLRTI